jgi:hypothetical protein
VDVIEFRLKPGRYEPKIDIVINGDRLVDLVHSVELAFAKAEGRPDRAGRYDGMERGRVGNDAVQHFLGSPKSHLGCGPHEKTVLLACDRCLEPGCWPLMARIRTTADTVAWSDFEQKYRSQKHVDYLNLGPDGLIRRGVVGPPVWTYDIAYVFERTQYESALSDTFKQSLDN